MAPEVEEIDYTPTEMPQEGRPSGEEEMVRRRSIAEPEQEEAPAEAARDPFPDGVPETPPVRSRPGIRLTPTAEETQRAIDESISQAWRLDGHPDQSSGPVLQLQQTFRENNPYMVTKEWHFIDQNDYEDLAEEEEAMEAARKIRARRLDQKSKGRDYWEVDMKNGRVIRHHDRYRKAPFNPRICQDSPFPVEYLEPRRETIMRSSKNSLRTIEDDWTKKELPPQEEWWRGRTTFWMKSSPALEAWVAEKKGQDEVDLRQEDQGLEEWQQADLSEWNKVTGSGAVEVMSLKESQEVRANLKAEGKENRILPTKIARRYEPAEQPGEPPTKQSRLCIRGDQDPDAMELERFSPTLNTVNFNILLQLAANQGMMATVGDLRNAFCQSKPLVRPNGPLYFQQLKEGVVGLHPEQIVRIINGCYGLIDAPLHWRRSLTEDLKALGYESSALDPCIFKLYGSKRKNLLGAIAIEVDDLFTVGHQAHHEKMKKLQEKYKFGKYVTLKEEKEGAAFNGRRIKQTPDGGFLIDMQKFVEERLRPVPLKKGRKSAKKEAVNEAEKNAARATCGALNWLSKEGRPDAAGPSSLMASKLNRLTIEDITQLNAVVKDLKEHSKLSLRIQPLAKMKLSVVTDASYANNGFHSQGGHLVIAHESHLRDGVPAPTNILAWRSAKLQRVVNSTMAAETQSLSKGLAELTWTMLLMKELSDGTLNIRDWREHLKTEELMVISSEETESELRESLAVIDAKSLYDHLTRETIGGSDKRTAIEIQIIRDDLRRLQGQVKWVEHLAMIADGLTKINGSNAALREVIRSGFFGIRPVESAMTLRDAAKKAGHSSAELRRIGTHNILGCCETGNDGMSMLGTNPSVDPLAQ